MKINPVYKKELKISVRSMKFAMIIFAYNFVLAVIGLFTFFLSFDQSVNYSRVNYYDILVVYAVITAIEIGLVLFTIPAFTSNSIAGERERQTLEILMTTKLRPIQIVTGKLASSISSILLLVFSSLPILSIVFAVGGISLMDLLQLMVLVIVTALFVGSIGIFFSALFKKTTSATVFTYGAILFLLIGTIIILVGTFLFLSVQADKNAAVTGIYKSPELGNFSLILLINPAITMIHMISNQFGAFDSFFLSFFNLFGKANVTIVNNWFVISCIVQLILAAFFILVSARLLDPLKRKQRVSKKNKKL